MKTLYDDLRAAKNLFAAWRHVKRSALNSSSGKIRGEASAFEHQHEKYIRRIQSDLQRGTFSFDKFEGTLKDKRKRESQGKDPRPIAIGSIKTRVVQRAILQVLQPRKILDARDINSKFDVVVDQRIGKLNEVNVSPFGVGGLMAPYGGTAPAIKMVMNSIRSGSTHYYRSDIKSFFTKIPTDRVVEIIKHETKDVQLTELFRDALRVELENEMELKKYATLFPKNGVGVAQGSSLSAFAGNVLLFDFDHQLNQLDVDAVRYIDDIFILSQELSSLDAAIQFAGSELSKFGFSLYKPTDDGEKAAKGLCRDGFTLLGCDIRPDHCAPSTSSVNRLVHDVKSDLSRSYKSICALAAGNSDFDPEHSQSSTIRRVGLRIYGWQKSFHFCNDRQKFSQVDQKTFHVVSEYQSKVRRKLNKAPLHITMRAIGIPSAAELIEKSTPPEWTHPPIAANTA